MFVASKDILIALAMKTSRDFFAFLCSVRESVAASDSVQIPSLPGNHMWFTLRSLLLAICGTIYFPLLHCRIWFMVCACAMSWHVF